MNNWSYEQLVFWTTGLFKNWSFQKLVLGVVPKRSVVKKTTSQKDQLSKRPSKDQLSKRPSEKNPDIQKTSCQKTSSLSVKVLRITPLNHRPPLGFKMKFQMICSQRCFPLLIHRHVW